VCAAFHRCEKTAKENIPLGKPIPNYKIYILDSNLNLVPIGVTGELYISGPGVARGYLNRPELTAEAFIDNPFLPGEKMYRTKDLARWYPMGEIEYLGRADRQVKIRGMRVELGEIESKILKHESIKAAVVTDVKNENNKKLLCAYYETTSHVSVQEIREYLRKELASHMIPSYYLEMDRIPLSASGKVNYKLLPGIDNAVLNEEITYVAPNDDVERRLVELMEKLLKLSKVGINDNYFELGGDSLDITTLAYDIMDEFYVDIPLESIFKAPTIKDIADIIKNADVKVSEDFKYKSKNLILLNRGNENNKNIIFVHDGIGSIGAYVDLCQFMNEYNIWGVRADEANNLYPKNTTIEEISRSYVDQIINECVPPYNIVGWCIGGTIGYEIVRQMENMELEVNSLLIIDSIPPVFWENEKRFSLKDEIQFLSDIFENEEVLEGVEDIKSVKELWEKVVRNIKNSSAQDKIIDGFIKKIPVDILGYLKGFGSSSFEEIFSFVNQLRTFHIARAFYFPIENIQSNIIYLEAVENSVVKDKSIWSRYTEGEINYKTVNGDHYTMMKMPSAKKLVDTIEEWVI
jgi:fengycin family lipopeptide synthetase D